MNINCNLLGGPDDGRVIVRQFPPPNILLVTDTPNRPSADATDRPEVEALVVEWTRVDRAHRPRVGVYCLEPETLEGDSVVFRWVDWLPDMPEPEPEGAT